jgi:septal ring factor EnvC (AmiA/AmiB activator)
MAQRQLNFRQTIVLGCALLSVPGLAVAQNKQKKELARIQSELRKTLAELESLRTAESALGKDVTRLQDLDVSSRKHVEHLQDVIRQAETRKRELKSRLDLATRVGGFWTAALTVEAAHHLAAASGRSDFYGTQELWSEEFRRAAIIEKGRHLRGLKGFERKTQMAEADTRKRAQELSQSRSAAEAERDDRRKEYESKKAQLEQTQTRLASAARRAKELEENAKAMTALIDKLGRAARSRKPTGAKAALDVPRHSLPWPVNGRVVSNFGREKDPELGTWTVRQGLTLAADAPSDVVAVAPGHVIYAGAFRSYGQVLIVDHGGGFFSVYGGLGEILKPKGADARSGEAIARVVEGSTSSPASVYFEIRRGTEALDPIEWLEVK